MTDKRKPRFNADVAGGIVLVATLVSVLVIANSPLNPLYQKLVHLPGVVLTVNQGLMAFFFCTLALAIKREWLSGELLNAKTLWLPIVAAVGGVLVPALLYLCFVGLQDPLLVRGWAIPIATDVVLALGLLAILGKRVPVSLKIFLTVLATVDDLIAIVVIAIFYTSHLSYLYLAYALLGVAILLLLKHLRITHSSAYVAVGALIWVALIKSGIHATLAGVIVGFSIPWRSASNAAVSPLLKLEKTLQPWVTFLILPAFVIINAGIVLTTHQFESWHTLSLGIALSLCLGKQIGIFSSTWLAIKVGALPLPRGSSWPQLYGIATLAGIGFTMSLFISTLTFGGSAAMDMANLGILAGSSGAAIGGLTVLYLSSKRPLDSGP